MHTQKTQPVLAYPPHLIAQPPSRRRATPALEVFFCYVRTCGLTGSITVCAACTEVCHWHSYPSSQPPTNTMYKTLYIPGIRVPSYLEVDGQHHTNAPHAQHQQQGDGCRQEPTAAAAATAETRSGIVATPGLSAAPVCRACHDLDNRLQEIITGLSTGTNQYTRRTLTKDYEGSFNRSLPLPEPANPTR